MIELAKANVPTPNANFFVEDISNPELCKIVGENQFDIVFSSWTVYHMENREKLKAFFTNAYKSLASNGTAFIYLMEDQVVHSSGIGKMCNVVMEVQFGNGKRSWKTLQ